ncbi:hypothetical protein DBV05_g6363 [Lasiodiplodia theobromae]|uniref:Uncharacterized protein n=2 Tax=Lasiodiplodia theobromae TaxID=45133 RepID=A0A5N5DB65_9PEZI|nr:hypothetical protein DBV05_g6363 [Lasiodiplodia theobromae]
MLSSVLSKLPGRLSSAVNMAENTTTHARGSSGQNADSELFVIIEEDEFMSEEHSHTQQETASLDSTEEVTAEEANAAARQAIDDEYARVVAIAAARGSDHSALSVLKDVTLKTAKHIGKWLHPSRIPSPEEARCPCFNDPTDGFYACEIQEHVAAGFKRLREKNKRNN